MAWTQSQIDTLKTAIATGTKTVNYGDKTVTYQDIPAMMTALAAMEAEVGASTSGRSTLAAHSRG